MDGAASDSRLKCLPYMWIKPWRKVVTMFID